MKNLSLYLIYLFVFLFPLKGFCQNKQTVEELHLNLSQCPISLKGNYKLILDTVGTKRVVKLTSGNGIYHDIVLNSLKASENTLGWIKFDTDSLFVVIHEDSYNCLTVFNKSDGKRLGFGGFLKFDASQNALVYGDWYGESGKPLGFLDFNTDRIKTYMPPVTSCLIWFQCVDNVMISEKEIQVKYYNKTRFQTQIYPRE